MNHVTNHHLTCSCQCTEFDKVHACEGIVVASSINVQVVMSHMDHCGLVVYKSNDFQLAMLWGHTRKYYLLSDKKYIRYIAISVWLGMSTNIDYCLAKYTISIILTHIGKKNLENHEKSEKKIENSKSKHKAWFTD